MYKRAPIEERFSDKYFIEPYSGCWLWTGFLDKKGYGRLRTARNSYPPAHRVSYELYIGTIPEGLTIDHLCRVRCCVNPTHLEPVSARENTLRGENNAARNARKTHCSKGHPLSAENIYWNHRGGRQCKICARAYYGPNRERINARRRMLRRIS